MSNSFVWGEGPTPCDFLVLGEAPGATEERDGRPFVGRSGDVLNLAIESAGRTRDDVFVTNAYKLRPPQNRTPTKSELADHELYLSAELSSVEPKYVLTLGATALFAMTGMNEVRRKRGEWIELDELLVLPTYHPAYVLRFPLLKETFTQDVRKFFARS